MRTIAYILLMLPLAQFALPSQAGELPIAFARAGQKVTFPTEADRRVPNGTVVLAAYGRLWGEPTKVESGKAQLTAPTVHPHRVPSRFNSRPAGCPR